MELPTYLSGTIQIKAYRILRAYVYDVLSEHAMTPTHWSMLGIILQAKDGVRQVEIAKTLVVKPPLITVMVRDLQQRGIVTSVQNQFDARAKLLAVTPEGKKLIRIIENELNHVLSQLLRGLSEDDLEAYHKVLVTIADNDRRLRHKG
jgi:MarR family transcriptional regulator for hemolysin